MFGGAYLPINFSRKPLIGVIRPFTRHGPAWSRFWHAFWSHCICRLNEYFGKPVPNCDTFLPSI
jgi:hypothetical protein